MITDKIRKIENLHIIFWLIKDTCWCLLYKPLGMVMVFPTVLIALWIAVRTFGNRSEFAHNLAVLFWICANSVWMYGEFYEDDGTRPIAIVFFTLGLLSLAIFYGSLLVTKTARNIS